MVRLTSVSPLTEVRYVSIASRNGAGLGCCAAPGRGASGEGPGSFRQSRHPAVPGRHDVPPAWTDAPRRSWRIGSPRRTVYSPRRRALSGGRRTASIANSSRSTRSLDGNGRTGRLVLNLLLVRLGYPPAIIYKNQRARYLEALRRADQGDAGALGELLARAILDNLYKFVIPSVAGPARLVPLAALADRRITASALRNAAHRGRLQATRGSDGHWRSSRDLAGGVPVDALRSGPGVRPARGMWGADGPESLRFNSRYMERRLSPVAHSHLQTRTARSGAVGRRLAD